MLEIAKSPSEQKWHIMLSDYRKGCECYQKRKYCECDNADACENFYFTIEYKSGSRWDNLTNMHETMIDLGCNFLLDNQNVIPESDITLAWCRDIYLYTVFFKDKYAYCEDIDCWSPLIEITYIDEKHFATDAEYYKADFDKYKILLINPNLASSDWSNSLKLKHGR